MTRKRTTTRKKSTSTRKKSSSTRGGTTRSRSKKTSTPKRSPRQLAQQRALIAGIAIVALTCLLILSLLSPNQGQLTQLLARLMAQLFGWAGYFVPLLSGAIGAGLFWWGMDQPLKLPIYRLVGFGILFVVVESSLSLGLVIAANEYADVWTVARAGDGGGYFGGLFAYVLLEAIGQWGAIVLLFAAGMVGVVLVSGVTRQELSYWLHSLRNAMQAERQERQERPPREIAINRGGRSAAAAQPVQPSLLPEAHVAENKATANKAAEKATPKPQPTPKRARRGGTSKSVPEVKEEPTIASPVFLGKNGRSTPDAQWQLPALADMLEPGMDHESSGTIIREQVEIIEHTLESFGAPATVVEINQGPTITQFGVEPSFLEMRSGKRTKVKVSKIASLADDLALALAAEAIRIQAPVPGKGYIGIEVPNPAKALVSLRDVMETAAYQKIKSPLRIGLGQDVAGQPIVADLAGMPHLLIAGTTGAGKSVCVNGIIASLLLQNTPDTLKLVMVDPKRVELTGYNGIPHLAAPVIVEIDKVIGTLQWALREMDNRYKMFAEAGARNIVEFNKKATRNSKLEPLPYIVIIIDELADLMMLSPEDTERAITRLAQLARATGMHMVIATQRPSVDVVTGLIKANFPARVAFAVASGTDSRVILDATGAERLLGQGDMLYQAPDAPAPVRAQGCWVSEPELRKLIEYWRTARRFNVISAEQSVQPKPAPKEPPKTAVAAPPSPPKPTPVKVDAPVVNMQTAVAANDATKPNPKIDPVKNSPPPAPPAEKATERETAVKQQPLWAALQEAENTEDEVAPPDDDLLEEAIALVRQLDKASTSLLQRRFRIGYTRAARLIDYMEEAGIIGPPTGTSKAREVLPVSDAAGNSQ